MMQSVLARTQAAGVAHIDCGEVALGIVAGLLEAQTGQKLTADRVWRVAGALSGVLRRHRLDSIDALATRLAKNEDGDLAQHVVQALLNNETYFLRDRAVFDHLATNVLPALAENRTRRRRLSIWSAGCSTGQEAYSLAMLFAQDPNRWRGWTIDILGTDVAADVVEAARRGNYSQFQIQRGLGMAQTISFFEETPAGWRARDVLRRHVRFAVHNLLDPPPSSAHFDLILCRNVLLYLDAARRRVAFEQLASGLAKDGRLILGLGETTHGLSDALESVRDGWGFRHTLPAAPAPPPVLEK